MCPRSGKLLEVTAGLDLDPVVVEAMKDLTAWVFRPHQRQLGSWRTHPKGMINSESRSAVIHTFKHLVHANHPLEPALLRAWALENHWPPDDAEIIRDYAEGVKAGVRYHTGPDPFGPPVLDRWVAKATGAT